MPSKKKKYNARFPAGRIKKIMQTDEEVGKVAQAVPVIISKALEMFIESFLKKSMYITQSRNAKTLTPSHMKQCILSESRFDFLKDLVKNIPDASVQEDNENNALAESNVDFGVISDEQLETPLLPLPKERRRDSATSTAVRLHPEQTSSMGTSTSRPPVIHSGPKVLRQDRKPPCNFSISSLTANNDRNKMSQLKGEPKIDMTIASESQALNHTVSNVNSTLGAVPSQGSYTTYGHSSTSDSLCIDEDYDN